MLKSHLLTVLISLSGLGSVLIPFVSDERYTERSFKLALFVAIVCCGLGIFLYSHFDPTQTGLQFKESYLWIKEWNIWYAVGVDGLSLHFILLTLFTTTLVILASWNAKYPFSSKYLSHLLLIQSLVIGSFAATNAIFFYICWESVLIPLCLTIGIWGSQRRAYASIKFFLYTFIGSSGLLIALLYLGNQHPTTDFSIQSFYALKLNHVEQSLIFLAFFIAFTIKIPLWPFHTWLPDAHTEAPTEGSMILAALMLKLGGYGLLRFCLPIVPDLSREYANIICILSVIAIIYSGLIALVQTDMKRLVAYASISHMGMVVLGIFIIFLPTRTLTPTPLSLAALEGAVIQMLSHGLSTAGLFLSIGYLYKNFQSRNIQDYRGLATLMPQLVLPVFLFLLSSIGLPGTAGFIGEFLIISRTVQSQFGLACLSALTLILSATYALWFYGRVFWGELHHPTLVGTTSMHAAEKWAFYLLSGSILLIGIWPSPVLRMTENTLQHLLTLSLQTKL